MPRLPSPLLALLPLLLAISASGAAPAPVLPARPNVLFIAIDDLRDWVGFLGGHPQARTPNFDRLARMGTAFTRAYCASPSCNPSRAALMSGLRPSTSGVYDNGIDFRPLIAPELALPHLFRQAGYFVHGAGKIYHESYRRASEWEHYLEKERAYPPVPPGRSDGVGGIKFAPLDCRDDELPDWGIADYAIASLARPHDRPFFLAVGLHKPHMPWNVPRKWFDLFPLDQIQLPPTRADDLADLPPAALRMAGAERDHRAIRESGRWREAVQAYLATIAYCDMNLGRVLDALEASPHRDRTIVCLWSDHGWHLGEKEHWGKWTGWQRSTRVPLIVAPPQEGATATFPRGAVCAAPVGLIDLYPTLIDLCGVAARPGLAGESLGPLLRNPAAASDRHVVTTFDAGNYALSGARWRYLRYADGQEELYDAVNDPHEWTNLAGRPEVQAVQQAMAAKVPVVDASVAQAAKAAGRAGRKKKVEAP